MSESVFDFQAVSIRGEPADLASQRGKVLLIVNTASECGFTPQFKGLEQLWQDYGPKGLVVIGFPSNEFGGQDPGGNDQIASFCELNYGVSFPMMEKVKVNGSDAHPHSVLATRVPKPVPKIRIDLQHRDSLPAPTAERVRRHPTQSATRGGGTARGRATAAPAGATCASTPRGSA
jgi:glutathione peroxidase-family protein